MYIHRFMRAHELFYNELWTEIVKQYKTLEQFLSTQELSVNTELDDGWGCLFPVVGVEIEATILFADISDFTQRTQSLTSTETLVFVNLFFSWITGEGLGKCAGIVDKYIGDEIMIVFSNQFGSSDHFADAIEAARWFSEYDEYGFGPHIGIASGIITVGRIGTKSRHDCSVFGSPVALAARCAKHAGRNTIVAPSKDWGQRKFEDIFHQEVRKGVHSDKVRIPWEMDASEIVNLKGFGPTELRIVRRHEYSSFMFNVEKDGSIGENVTTADVVRESVELLRKAGIYKPKPNSHNKAVEQ